MLSAIDRKLLRDLARLKGQILTIAIVVAAGAAAYISLQSTFSSLELSRARYYREYRFGDVFAHLKRAPLSLHERLQAIPGVAQVDLRVVDPVRLPMQGETPPPMGEVVSLPDGRPAPLNPVYLRAGRMLEPGRSDQALLLEKFAQRFHVQPGDTLPVVMNGKLRQVRIVGLAASPEFIYPMRPGTGVEDERFAVLWMNESAVAPAFQMDGAFDDLVLSLQHGASEAVVLGALERLLEPYGIQTAVGRDKQPSNYVLNGELEQLQSLATVIPIIFLGVAAFVLNVVLSRLIHLQRAQIASLKAIGYSNVHVGLHYLKLVTAVVMLGVVLGVALGGYLGHAMTGLYARIFGFPVLAYRLEPRTVVTAGLVSLVAGAVGALFSTRRAVRLPPAEAMRPEPPGRYRLTWVDRIGLTRLFGPASGMVAREIARRPMRLMLSVLGVAMAVGILVVGRFNVDAVDHLIDVQFRQAWRDDLSVSFITPVPSRELAVLARLPGVTRVEGARSVAVRFRAGHRWRDSVIFGYPREAELRRVLDGRGAQAQIPDSGVLLTRKLAEVLGLHLGDTVTAELREGDRRHLELRVTGLVDEMFGMQGYMRLSELGRRLDEPKTISMAFFKVARASQTEVEKRLDEMPDVESISSNQSVVASINRQMAETVLVMTLIVTLFAASIAIGVVYNNARVALSMRSRELASLRVLGFTRAEISRILLGELSVQVLLALPLGMLIGTWMARAVMSTVDPERFRFPVVISAQTYAFAVLVTLIAALASALFVRRELDRLDLIGVLKTQQE